MSKDYRQLDNPRECFPKKYKLTVTKSELLEAFEAEESLDRYIDKLIDRIVEIEKTRR